MKGSTKWRHRSGKRKARGGRVMNSVRVLDVALFDKTVAAIALFAGPEHRLVLIAFRSDPPG